MVGVRQVNHEPDWLLQHRLRYRRVFHETIFLTSNLRTVNFVCITHSECVMPYFAPFSSVTITLEKAPQETIKTAA